MYVIKMESDKTLTTTIRSKIYQGENIADILTFLLPKTYENIDFADCTVYLRYILPNGVGQSEELSMYPLPYNDEYYQYRLPIESRFTNMRGQIELWLTAIDTAFITVLRTSPALVMILPAKDITDYLSDEDRNQLDKMLIQIEQLEKGKADSLIYDDDTRELQLTAEGAPIGDIVIVPSDDYSGGSDDGEWGDMEDDSGDQWDDMDEPDTPPDDDDAYWEDMT